MKKTEQSGDAGRVGSSDELGERYVKCINCAHAISWHAHEHLRVALDCHNCGCKKQFGPGIYIDDFQGYTLEEVMQRRSDWLAREPNADLDGTKIKP